MVEELAAVWDVVEAAPEVRALIIASPNPALFCAGADIRAFTEWEPSAGEEHAATRATRCCAAGSARRR